MAKQVDKQAIFQWLRSGVEKIGEGVQIGTRKVQEAGEAIHEKIESSPRAKNFKESLSKFAQEQSEKFKDVRIKGTRIGDLPNAAQRLTERQIFKLIQKIHDINPDFAWNQYVPKPDDLPIFAAFECLGLPYGTPYEEVRKTYRRLMREYHPDRHADSPEEERAATIKTQEITAAYELITQHYGK